MNVLITAPHVCVSRKSRDPGCDTGTRAFATRIHESIPSSKLFITTTMRKICDNNRPRCRKSSSMRKRLSTFMDPPFLLFDIHSFTGARDFRLSKSVSVVLLTLRRNQKLASVLSHYLSFRGVSHSVIEGSLKNDIILESTEKGGYAVLIEILESEDVESETFKSIVQAIRMTVEHMANIIN